MNKPDDSKNELPPESSILQAGASLESILCTEELQRRPSRAPEFEKENRALVELVSTLADSPHTILQTLANIILEITQSDSAGLSLLTRDDGGKRFYWPAIAGMWNPHAGGGTPRNFGPCGDVLDCNRTLLFKHFERRYPYLQPVMPAAEECLLVPFYVAGKAVGTIWAIMHSNRRKFDAEDQRVMESLGKFASSAYQALTSIDELKFQVAEREKAEKDLRQLTGELDMMVRVRTEELEQRNLQLSETKARLAEEKAALERSQVYLAEAQRLSHVGSWYWNTRTNEVVWSQEFFSIFDFDPESVEPSYPLYLERVHPEDRAKLEEARWAAVNEKRDFEAEYRLLLPEGQIKYLRSLGHVFESQSGNVELVGAIVDITEPKQAEEERERFRRALADLAHINRVTTMGELTASLAHEIKQPIGAALMDAGTCLRWLTRDQPDLGQAQEAVSRVVKDVSRASETIERIGSLFKKEAVNQEMVEVNELIQEMIALLQSEAALHLISIRGDLIEGLPPVMADRVQLKQVLMNLMLNGIEAMKETGAPGELTIKAEKDQNYQLRITVADTGVGLRPEQMEQIFQPFFTSKPQGTGMGLPISRSIIESHGGRVWATAKAGPGATIQFTLPIEAAAHQTA